MLRLFCQQIDCMIEDWLDRFKTFVHRLNSLFQYRKELVAMIDGDHESSTHKFYLAKRF